MYGLLKCACLKRGSLCISGFEKIWNLGQGGTATKYVNAYVEECDGTLLAEYVEECDGTLLAEYVEECDGTLLAEYVEECDGT